jgi:hypothetical protein
MAHVRTDRFKIPPKDEPIAGHMNHVPGDRFKPGPEPARIA